MSTHSPQTRKDMMLRNYMAPLEPYISDSEVTEIVINGPEALFTKTQKGWKHHIVPKLSRIHLEQFVRSICSYNGIERAPRMSVTYPDGERGEIVMSPAILEGTIAFAIRKHLPIIKTLEDFERDGMFDETDKSLKGNNYYQLNETDQKLMHIKENGTSVQFLREAIKAKKNIVISGATHSGKTVFSRGLVSEIPVTERIITIEDTHELFLPNHLNKVHLLYGSGQGRISAKECLTACMRLSPQRIFLAEIRGDETLEYLNSLNTGHPGSITTVHANDAMSVFDAIVDKVKKTDAGKNIEERSFKNSLFRMIDIVAHFENRKCKQIYFDPEFAKQKGL